MENRRDFLKKLATVGVTAASVGAIGAIASTNKESINSNGVVVGKSPKKEIIYKKTRAWEDYYSSAI